MDRHKILVVDDEESIRHFLRGLLEIKGCEVHAAGSAEEAVEMLAGLDPDVALVDMVLPGMNGLRLTGKIKQVSRPTVVVMMTSQESTKVPLNAIRMGAFDYLQKPFNNLEHVWNTVRRALEKNREARETEALLAGPLIGSDAR